MVSENILNDLKSHFLNSGFNLFLAINPKEYDKSAEAKRKTDAIFPMAKSIFLVGFAGKEFWGIFQEYLRENPKFKKNNDLIDSYSVLKFNEASKILDKNNYKAVFPFGESALDLNFVKLAELGGAGVPSLLGILLHPIFGTWISLRGALITDLEIENYDTPISNFAPCPSCDKPCITACPASTISESGWDWEACMRFRIEDTTCSQSCASRLACPYGQEEQYSKEQIKYHHDFVLKSARKYFNNISQ